MGQDKNKMIIRSSCIYTLANILLILFATYGTTIGGKSDTNEKTENGDDIAAKSESKKLRESKSDETKSRENEETTSVAYQVFEVISSPFLFCYYYRSYCLEVFGLGLFIRLIFPNIF